MRDDFEFARLLDVAGHELFQRGDLTDAEAYFRELIEVDPEDATTYVDLGVTLAKQGNIDQGIAQLREALRRDDRLAAAHFNLGFLFQGRKRTDEAVRHFQRAVSCQPDCTDAHFYLAVILEGRESASTAVKHYRSVVRQKPNHLAALNNLAWLLATHQEAEIRDGREAVRLALRAAELTQQRDVNVLNTLAAAYAEAARFDDAVVTTNRALQLLGTDTDVTHIEKLRRRLRLYQGREPYREVKTTP